MSKDDYVKLKVDYDPYKGEIKFNVLDFIRELDDESKEELLFDGGWWSFVSDSLRQDIKAGFADPNYNPTIYHMRNALLNADDMPEILTKFLEGVTRRTFYEIKNMKQYYDAYWNIFHALSRDKDPRIQEVIRQHSHFENAKESKMPDYKNVEEFVNNFIESTNMFDYLPEKEDE